MVHRNFIELLGRLPPQKCQELFWTVCNDVKLSLHLLKSHKMKHYGSEWLPFFGMDEQMYTWVPCQTLKSLHTQNDFRERPMASRRHILTTAHYSLHQMGWAWALTRSLIWLYVPAIEWMLWSRDALADAARTWNHCVPHTRGGNANWYDEHGSLCTKSTIHQWRIDKFVTVLIRWLWVGNDFKLQCFMALMIGHAWNLLRGGVCSHSGNCMPCPSDKSCCSPPRDDTWGEVNGPLLVLPCQYPTNTRQS